MFSRRMLVSRLTLLIGCVFSLSSCGMIPKIGENNVKDTSDWVVIPVFYATNRKSIGEGNVISYSEEPNGTGLIFGVRNVAVPVPTRSPLDAATTARMKWSPLHLDKPISASSEPSFSPDQCTIKDKVVTRDEAITGVEKYMKATDSKNAVLFVHGCCVNFDLSLIRAGRLAAHCQEPVLVYDWVSPKGFTNYLVNETRISQTVDDFSRFVARLEELTDPGNITMLGHSMGTQLVDQAMVRRASEFNYKPHTKKFQELILSNADIDAQSFLNHGKQFALNANKARLYISTKDARLDTSTTVHGGLRIGEPRELTDKVTNIPGLEVIDVTADNLGHDLPYWLIANMHRYQGVGPAKDFKLKQNGPNYLSLETVEGAGAIADAKTEECCNQ
jgi:esterase/lipase superfamily enzyme